MPTMNRVDMLNCAAGHHDFSDDASECHVCGHGEAASAPADPVRDAAPDMLAALKEALEVMGDWGDEGEPAWSERARAAIAKAEGRANG